MSNLVSALVQRRKVGSPTRKSVLMLMAACASDDGTGVWSSKANMARDLEMGKRTVQNCVEDLLNANLISQVGKRKCKNGFTTEYRLNLDAISALDRTRAGDAPVQEMHLTRAGDAPQDVQDVHPNSTGTILEPSEVPPLVPPPKKPPPKARLPENWALSDEGWRYALEKGLNESEITELENEFQIYWSERTDKGGRKTARGWEQTWRNRVADRFATIIRNRRASQPNFPSGNRQGTSLASIAARRRLEAQN